MYRRRAFIGLASAFGLAAAGPVSAQNRTRSGSFGGMSDHSTSGTVEVSPAMVVLQGDFRFDGAPDPRVALGRNGYDPGTVLGSLVANSGRQSYRIPARIDPTAYNEVWIWCQSLDLPLGMARIG